MFELFIISFDRQNLDERLNLKEGKRFYLLFFLLFFFLIEYKRHNNKLMLTIVTKKQISGSLRT